MGRVDLLPAPVGVFHLGHVHLQTKATMQGKWSNPEFLFTHEERRESLDMSYTGVLTPSSVFAKARHRRLVFPRLGLIGDPVVARYA